MRSYGCNVFNILRGDARRKRRPAEFCGIYLKAGDPSYRIEVKPGGRRNRNQLSFTVSRSFKDHFGSETLHFCQMFPDFSRKEWMSFDLTDQTSEDNRLSCGFLAVWNEEELWLEFQGRSDGMEDRAVGRYYPDDCYVMPEAFFRPLNRADLWGLAEEDMRILRNQFYAAHGRAFADEGLRTYFENQPWYGPEAASSSGNGGEEPADFDETVFSGVEKRNIEFLLDMEKMLSEKENPQTASDEPDYYFITYEPYSGNYHLWQNSADTLFQPVYEGDIFILKGAQEEYVNYFPISISSHPEGPYALRNISPEREFFGDDYGGNYPVFDSRGYLKALYYAGD